MSLGRWLRARRAPVVTLAVAGLLGTVSGLALAEDKITPRQNESTTCTNIEGTTSGDNLAGQTRTAVVGEGTNMVTLTFTFNSDGSSATWSSDAPFTGEVIVKSGMGDNSEITFTFSNQTAGTVTSPNTFTNNAGKTITREISHLEICGAREHTTTIFTTTTTNPRTTVDTTITDTTTTGSTVTTTTGSTTTTVTHPPDTTVTETGPRTTLTTTEECPPTLTPRALTTVTITETGSTVTDERTTTETITQPSTTVTETETETVFSTVPGKTTTITEQGGTSTVTECTTTPTTITQPTTTTSPVAGVAGTSVAGGAVGAGRDRDDGDGDGTAAQEAREGRAGLAFTGFEPGLLVLVGLGMAGAGVALRRRLTDIG